MSETCANCQFANVADVYGNIQCRRYPPIPMHQVALDGSGASYSETLKTWVSADDWCGEHQPGLHTTRSDNAE